MIERIPMLAVSRAGHDKGKVYAVAGMDESWVFLVNGTTRKKDNPKKKRKIHVQLVKHLPEDIFSALSAAESDEALRAVIELYQGLKMEENECQRLT